MSKLMNQEEVDENLTKLGEVAAWLESIPTQPPLVETSIETAILSIGNAHRLIVVARGMESMGIDALREELGIQTEEQK